VRRKSSPDRLYLSLVFGRKILFVVGVVDRPCMESFDQVGELNDRQRLDSSPIVVTTSGTHPFSDGDQVWLRYINGNLAANGFHVVDNSTSTTFELAGSTGSGTYAVGGSTDTAVEVPVLPGKGHIEMRRKPSGGSWIEYRSSRFDIRFPPVHPDGTVVLPFVIPRFEVTAAADDQFELSIVVQAGEDITISSSGDFDPAGNVRVNWEAVAG
jgi:hypothetical protein